MATKKTKLEVVLTTPQPKKHVTRYDAPDNDAALTAIYVRNPALAQIGNPDKIKVTIEAA